LADLKWGDVREDWVDDGGLPDVLVQDATSDDWDRVLDVVRDRGWPTRYSVDGDVASMPGNVSPIFEIRHDKSVRWEVRPHPDVAVNCHFFAIEEIGFDVSPREVVDEETFDAFCEFVTAIGRALGKPVDVTADGAPSDVFMRYEPAADRLVRVPPPPTISLLDRLGGRS